MKQSPNFRVAVYTRLYVFSSALKTKYNLATHSIICNPLKDCSGAFESGKSAFDYYLRRGGSETDFHEKLGEGLCENCKTNLMAGFFIRKDERGV